MCKEQPEGQDGSDLVGKGERGTNENGEVGQEIQEQDCRYGKLRFYS